MFFRNVTIFRFPVGLAALALLEGIAEYALKPVGPLEAYSRGFVSPLGADSDTLVVHAEHDALWLTVGTQQRVLPGSVVNGEWAARIAQAEAAAGREIGGRARRQLKEDLVHELLPRALVKHSRIDACLDLRDGVLYVDTAVRKQAEAVVSQIRTALGSFPALPLNAEVSPRQVLTNWMPRRGSLPISLWLGEEAVLRDPIDGGAMVRVQHQDLNSEEIDKHLEAGKVVTRLALTVEDRLQLVVGDDLVLRKLRPLDAVYEKLEHLDLEDRHDEVRARFAILVGELRPLFAELGEAFQFSVPEAA